VAVHADCVRVDRSDGLVRPIHPPRGIPGRSHHPDPAHGHRGDDPDYAQQEQGVGNQFIPVVLDRNTRLWRSHLVLEGLIAYSTTTPKRASPARLFFLVQ